jgi:hypothetical protein
MRNGRVVWTSDSLTHGLTWFKRNVDDEIQKIVEEFADECQSHMKANAPWEDRTGDARNTLTGTAYEKGDVHGVLLAHGVTYGRFLEFRFGGRDAIVIPTLEEKGPELMARLNGLLNRVEYQGIG